MAFGQIAMGVGMLASGVAAALPLNETEHKIETDTPTGNLQQAGEYTGAFAGLQHTKRQLPSTFDKSGGAKVLGAVGSFLTTAGSASSGGNFGSLFEGVMEEGQEAMGGTEDINPEYNYNQYDRYSEK